MQSEHIVNIPLGPTTDPFGISATCISLKTHTFQLCFSAFYGNDIEIVQHFCRFQSEFEFVGVKSILKAFLIDIHIRELAEKIA